MATKDMTSAEIARELENLGQEGDLAVEEATLLKTMVEEEDRMFTEDEQKQFDEYMTASAAAYDAHADLSARAQAARNEAMIAQRQMDRTALPSARQILQGSDSQAMRVSRMHVRLADDPRLGFANIGELAADVWRAGMPGQGVSPKLVNMQAATGMSQGTGADGGFVVAPEFRTNIWNGVQMRSADLLGMTDQFPITGESLEMPANAETSRATGSRYGGIRGYWLGEGTQMTASQGKLRMLRLEPQQLGVLVYVTDKLLNNAGALTTWLNNGSADEIAFMIGDAFINGDGVAKPLGIMSGNGLVSVAKESAQTAATLVVANINKMWARMPAFVRSNAVWFINQDVEPQLDGMSSDGSGQVPLYLPTPEGFPTITQPSRGTLKGRPVIPIEYCQTLGTKGDIILTNMQYYATGVNSAGIDTAVSMHLRFDYNESAFRFLFSIDGKPWVDTATTPFKGTGTLSPYVTLDTRA